MFTKNIAAFCIVVVLFYQSIAFAEGKMRVIVPPVREPQSSELLDCYLSPNWGSSETEMKDEPIIVPTHTEKEISKSNPINAIKLQNGNVTISLPEPQTTSELKPAKLFASPTLRALITWNGKSDENGEEIMIVSSDEISKTGFDEAVVGIIPLPGKPLDIKRVDDKIFEKIQLLLHRKYDHKGEAVIYGQIPQYPVIADYSIIIAKFENIDHFADDVNSYIQIQYDKERINIEVQPEELNVIKKYWDKGFRYFAFDLSLLLNKVSRKSPILFRFKSSYAYYPLAINTIGGTGRGYIDLIVMTPEKIRLTKDFEQEAKTKETTIRVVGNKSVNVTKDELQTLDPDLSQFWSGDENDSITVCRFVFAIKDIGDFDADFVATQTEKQKNVIDSEQTAVFPENSQLLFVFGTNEKDVLPVVQTSK
ncbi:MAG: hypothetical protein LBG58_01550 [Planctomycetaceae bacterium]|jgi:hypothetical protein|nr:hypothetical protein [Planctomycetaceae bacterium]